MSLNFQPLGDIVSISKGRKHIPIENGKIRYINIENLHNSANSLFTNESGVHVEEHDLIIAWDGANAGKVGVGFEGVIGSTLARLKIKVNNVISRYLFWYLESKNELIKSQRTGATIPHVNGNSLKDLQIPLPPLATQKRIAEILDAADALRRKDQELLKKYDELAQVIFIDMFGDPVKNEMGWDVKRLSDILDVDTKSIDPNELDEYSYIGLEHIEKETGKILVIDKGKVVSNKFLFTKDHILYGKLRPYLNKVAVPDFNGICSTDIFPLKPKNKLMKQYLVTILRSKEFVNHSNTNAVGANLPRANKDIILNFRTIVPKIEMIIDYSKSIDFIDIQKDLIENKIIKSELLFSSLIQKAFNGELVS
jgi:type I restriction enzyme S subunit